MDWAAWATGPCSASALQGLERNSTRTSKVVAVRASVRTDVPIESLHDTNEGVCRWAKHAWLVTATSHVSDPYYCSTTTATVSGRHAQPSTRARRDGSGPHQQHACTNRA